jgi:mono/diheme cytochrome c family protein
MRFEQTGSPSKLSSSRRPRLFLASTLLLAFAAALAASAGEPKTAVKAMPAQSPERLALGQELFRKATCIGCHARGENALNGDKPLKGQAFLKKFQNDQAFIDFVRRGSPERGMPPFSAQRLSDEDLKNILFYVRTFSTANNIRR